MNTTSGALHFETGIDNSRLQTDANEAKGILRGISQSAEKEGSRIDEAYAKIGKTIAGVFTVKTAAEFAQSLFKVRAEVESLEISFETLLGSRTKAQALFGDIRQFAASTPMMLNDLAKGAQMLLSFNIEAEKVMPTLRALGDISMGDSQKFNSLTLAFSQMSSTGKLMGQDLLQMINAGFNPLTVISEKTGKSVAALKDEMSAGAISAEMVADAFMSATQEGGKFYNMLEKQSKGLAGSWSNLQGAWDDMLNELGTKTQGVMSEAMLRATDLLHNYEKIGEAIKELVIAVGTYKAALITLNVVKSVSASLTKGWTIAELAHYKALLLAEKAQKLLNATILKNPYVLAAAAVAAVAVAIYKMCAAEDKAKAAAEDHAQAVQDLNAKYEQERQHTDELINTLQDETATRVQQIQAIDELKRLYPDVFEKYIDEKGHITDLIALQKELNAVRDNNRMSDNADTLAQYERKLRDFKQLKTAEDNGWDWASAGTSEHVSTLTADMPFWKTNDAYIKEQISYWEKMVSEQRKVVDADNETKWIARLKDSTAEELEALKKAYEERRMKFGEVSEADQKAMRQIEEEIAARNPKPVVHNKAYWEGLKKEAETELEALSDIEAKGAKGQAIRKRIASYQSNVDAFSAVNGGKGTANSADKVAEATVQRTEKIRQYQDSVAAASKQAEFAITQAEIDAMDEGLNKQLAQNKLNYDRLIFENKQREAELVSAYRDTLMLAWENENPNATDSQKTAMRKELNEKVTAEQLPQQQKAQIAAYAKVAAETFTQSNKEALEAALEDYKTYEDRRAEVIKEYAQRRDALKNEDGTLKTGVSEGNMAELDYHERQALYAIDEQFASREDSFQAWMNEISNLSLAQLEAVLKQAQEELEKAKSEGASGTKLAEAQAKVTKAQQAISETKAKNDTGVSKRSIKEWEDLYKVLNECNDSFKDIGDTVGGVAGEIISAAGGIMSSTLTMVNGIVQLVNMSATGMQGTATAGAAAVSTIEKASVILTVISSAIQIASSVVKMFNTDDQKQEEIEALQTRIDQLQWELDNADVVRLQERTGKAVERVQETYANLYAEMLKVQFATQKISSISDFYYAFATAKSKALAMSVQKVADAYANIAYTADKALGSTEYDSARSQLENITQQQLLISQQIDEERSKKKTDYDQIKEWEQKIEELGEQAVSIINGMVEEIIGGSAADIASQLGDAFVEAFRAGEDAAEAWHEKVNDIVSDVVKQMLVKKLLEEPLGEIFDRYKSKWFTDGRFNGIDAVNDSMTGFAGELNALFDAFAEGMDAIPEDLKDILLGEAERSATDKGIASASQDSVDELNGRMTAVQGHTYSISENTKILVSNTSAILRSVQSIEESTDSMNDRLSNVETSLSSVRNTVNDIALKGIKIR